VTRATELSPELVLAVNLALSVAAPLAAGILLGRALGWHALVPSRDLALLNRVVRTGISLHATSVAVFLNLRIDLLMVGIILDARDAGLYSLSVNLAGLGAVATATIGLAALKDQTELEPREAVAYTVAFTRRTVVYAMGFAALAILVSRPLIAIAYGSEWTDAALPFALLSAGCVALAVETPARGLLLRIGRPWTISLAAVAATVVNVVANLILLPTLGLVGAALASMASYATAAALMVLLLRQETRRLAVAPPLAVL
jgi:O-antigen/teichoic acid export membrane protein